MRIGTCLIYLLTGALVISNVQIAFGNGRTTPRPRGASPLKAICSQSEGGQLEIFRVKLVGGDGSDETLKVTIEGVTEGLSLSEIKQLRFLTTEINADGFMKTEISRTDGAEETSAMVQVRSGDTMIRLTGFRSSSASISTQLSRCQAVAFSLVGEGETDSNYGGTKKK